MDSLIITENLTVLFAKYEKLQSFQLWRYILNFYYDSMTANTIFILFFYD